jgi:predicted O-methyltransferase YrrM
VKQTQPLQILEWGPGYSRHIFLECAPQASIVSIEHDTGWHNRALQAYGDRADIRFKPFPLRGGPADYAVAPLLAKEGPFDLIFVDGRRRVECLLVASKLVTDTGVVILHDADRVEYNPGIELFTVLDNHANGRTKVLSKHPEAFPLDPNIQRFNTNMVEVI